MSSAIDRVHTHAAPEAGIDRQHEGKTAHAGGDRFARTVYKEAEIAKRARMEKPAMKRSLAKLAKRPQRTVSSRGANASAKPPSSKRPALAKSHSWRDTSRQGGGNGRSGNQGDHDEDDENEAANGNQARSGKFSVSRKSRHGAVVALSDELQSYAASVRKQSNGQFLVCKHGIQQLNQLPKAPAFDKAQTESHHLLTPLMAHQVFSLHRSPSQLLGALARKEGQVRGCATPSGGAVQATLLDMLAASAQVDETAASGDAPGLTDIIKILRDSRVPK